MSEELSKKQDTLKAAALRLLARREHSRRELSRKLKARGYPRQEISSVLSWLVENHYLSEMRFAEARARALIRKNFGPNYIEKDLKAAGVELPAGLLERVYQELGTTPDEQLEVLFRKRGRGMSRRSLVKHLNRRGFDPARVMTLCGARFQLKSTRDFA